MIHTIVLLGIYILLVTAVFCIAQFRPHLLWRLHPIPVVALFSFVPAIALGRETLLRTELWDLLSTVPIWLSTGLSILFFVAAVPARKWIHEGVLERTVEAARGFLDQLPERMMPIEAAESRREISVEEATERKMQIQRDADRISAIDGTGRLLYWLLKLHIVRLGLQIAATVVLGFTRHTIPVDHILRWAGIEGLVIFVPYLMPVVALQFLAEPETAAVH